MAKKINTSLQFGSSSLPESFHENPYINTPWPHMAEQASHSERKYIFQFGHALEDVMEELGLNKDEIQEACTLARSGDSKALYEFIAEKARAHKEASSASHEKAMDLEISTPSCLCSVELTINGINGDIDDFGIRDWETEYDEDADDFSCSCVWEPAEPSKSVCEKYGISEEQFREVAARIGDELKPFTNCGWCD